MSRIRTYDSVRSRGRLLACVCMLALLAAGAGGDADLPEDQPLPAARPGHIRGRITPAEAIAELSAVSRETGRRYEPEELDTETGRFVFGPLPGDAAYDLVLLTTDRRRYEGIDLSFVDSRFLRLARIRREQLDLPPERDYEFARRDAEQIVEWIESSAEKDFLELARVLYVHGDGPRATVLLERMRRRPDYAGDSRYIWRIELWYFVERFGGWEKLPNQSRVLWRLRVPATTWRQLHVEYLQELSVFIPRDGESGQVEFSVPEDIDPNRGRPPRTAPDIKTTPRVLGLDTEEETASQPAEADAD